MKNVLFTIVILSLLIPAACKYKTEDVKYDYSTHMVGLEVVLSFLDQLGIPYETIPPNQVYIYGHCLEEGIITIGNEWPGPGEN